MKIESNNIYCGDCLELLKMLPDKSIDCIVSDVAYKTTSRGSTGTMGGYWKEDAAKKGKIFKTNDIDIEDYLQDLYRVLKESSHCYLMCNNVNLTHFLEVIGKSPFKFVKLLVWDKQSKICGTYYMGQVEFIILMRKGAHRAINDCSTPDLLSFPIPKNKAKDKDGLINPTQKPVGLFETLIRNSTNVGDTVLDPMAGSCTTARACLSLERRYICFDIDERQVKWAKNDLKHHEKQFSLFK